MGVNLAVEAISTTAGFEALAPEWWDLWRRAPAATPFQSPAWAIPWWRHFGPGELLAVAVRHRGRLVGLAPFYVEDGALGRRILPIGISLSDYLDVLLDPDTADAAGAALVAFLAGEATRWDRWELEELCPEASAHRLACPDRCHETVAAQSACPVLILPEAVAGLPDRIPSGRLRKLRMARHRAARRDGFAVARIEAVDAGAFLEALVALHGARWRSRGEAGVLAGAAVRRFHEDAVPALIAADLLRSYVLRIEGRIVGVHYGFAHRGRTYAYLGGFEPAFGFESPGTVLMGHAIEEAVREGAREFHFLRGREPYKYEWGAVDRWNRRRSFRRAAPHA